MILTARNAYIFSLFKHFANANKSASKRHPLLLLMALAKIKKYIYIEQCFTVVS